MRLFLLYSLLALVLAGIIHIAAVMSLPALAQKDAWNRLAALGPSNTMIQIPPAKPGGDIMPMTSPDMRIAFCRFDLSGGPISVRAAVPDDLWMIAFYTPQGDNFYTVAGADMKRPEIDLIIASDDQTVVEAGVDAPEEADQTVVVKSPVARGIAMIREPLSGPSHRARAEEALKATFCGPHAQ